MDCCTESTMNVSYNNNNNNYYDDYYYENGSLYVTDTERENEVLAFPLSGAGLPVGIHGRSLRLRGRRRSSQDPQGPQMPLHHHRRRKRLDRQPYKSPPPPPLILEDDEEEEEDDGVVTTPHKEVLKALGKKNDGHSTGL
ncbi:chemokine-like receptor 1 isoform X2 [Bufo gargarizans]|uniref:chemokine-like receptor 1 isoform X2 n=1 Tax=Bufo gargarizans TaxID=30331 RepID=UPI001CF2FFAB|nr:chemokine-like receptor 1 isoform X2 [Bufo gargarizans]